MSFYIDEETRTRFKLACTATGTSMNQVLVDMVDGWLDSNDPFKTHRAVSAPEPQPSPSSDEGETLDPRILKIRKATAKKRAEKQQQQKEKK